MSDINIPGIGSLEPRPALDHLDLLAPPVAAALTALAERGVATASSALVVAIDPELADTETMTREFGMDLALSSNCILVAGKRAGEERIAACVVRATTNTGGRARLVAPAYRFGVRVRLELHRVRLAPLQAIRHRRGPHRTPGCGDRRRPRGLKGRGLGARPPQGDGAIAIDSRRRHVGTRPGLGSALPLRFTRVSRGTRPGRQHWPQGWQDRPDTWMPGPLYCAG